MPLRRPLMLTLVIGCALLAFGLAVWLGNPQMPSSGTPHEPEKSPVASEEVPVAETKPAYPHWGGALNSAEEDGRFFFDRARGAAFEKAAGPDAPFVIALNSRALLPDPAAKAAEAFKGEGEQAVYLQFRAQPTKEQREQLEQAGVKVHGYIAGIAWKADGSREALTAARSLPFVRAMARMDARDKLHQAVYLDKRPAYALTADGRVRYHVLAYAGTTLNDLTADAQAVGIQGAALRPAHKSVLGPRFELSGDRDAVLALAASPRTQFVELVPPPAETRDAVTDTISNINDVRDAPPNLTGAGVTVAVREVNSYNLHSDFSVRFEYVDPHTPPPLDVQQDHPTGVAGVIGGSGLTVPTAKGVATGVNLLGYTISAAKDPDDSTILEEPTFSTEDIEDAELLGARISNHSYGPTEVADGSYRTESADWDAAAADHDLVIVFAGNEDATPGQYGHVDYLVGSKNVIDVTATSSLARAEDDSPSTTKKDGIAYFVDFGPMEDGRVKPDLAAYGTSVKVLMGTNGSHILSGTSFACPAVSGMAALLFEHHMDLLTGAEPSAALTKALLINSASDVGTPGPDGQYGFGIANVEKAVKLIDTYSTSPAANKPWYEGSVAASGEFSQNISIGTQSELKVTLVWMDPPGDPVAAHALVNDLDLEVQYGPGPTIHYPYTLGPAIPSPTTSPPDATPPAPATNTGKNSVDNVEQVVIKNPTAGIYKIVVKGPAVLTDGPQAFAIVVNIEAMAATLSTSVASPNKVINGITYLRSTGGDVTFTAKVISGIAPYTYTFNYNDGKGNDVVPASSNTTESKTHTFDLVLANTEYTVTLTVTDTTAGTPQTATATVKVVLLIPPVADFEAAPETGELPLTVAFDGSGSTGVIATYKWTFGDSSAMKPTTSPTTTYTYETIGTFTATLTVTDVVGQTSTNTSSIEITTVKRQREVYAHRFRANLNFTRSTVKVQFTLIVAELALSRQEARTQYESFKGKIWEVRLNEDDLGSFTLDDQGRDYSQPDRKIQVVLSRLGQIRVTCTDPAILDIFTDLKMTADPDSSTDPLAPDDDITVPVEVESHEAIYNTEFSVIWTNTRGTSGKARNRRIP